MSLIFLDKELILQVQARLIDEFGGIHGVCDYGLLESALIAAQNRRHYEGADRPCCAATLAFHLTSKHPFVDGNKRIGAAAAEILINLNGKIFAATNDQVVELFLSIAAGAVSRNDVEDAIRRWVVPA